MFLFSSPHIGRICLLFDFLFSVHPCISPGGGVLKLLYTPGWLCFCNAKFCL
jgi:hypothetical protein